MTNKEIFNYYYCALLPKLHLITAELMELNKNDKESVILILKAHGFYLPYITGRPENFASYGKKIEN